MMFAIAHIDNRCWQIVADRDAIVVVTAWCKAENRPPVFWWSEPPISPGETITITVPLEAISDDYAVELQLKFGDPQ